MLVTPAATVATSPSFGFSAVVRKVWNTLCSIKGVVNTREIRPYTRQSSIITSVAPSRRTISGRNTMPSTVARIPQITVNSTIMEKYRLASSCFPSPSVMDVSALPPVPNMNPIPPTIIRKGITRLMDAKGIFPT